LEVGYESGGAQGLRLCGVGLMSRGFDTNSGGSAARVHSATFDSALKKPATVVYLATLDSGEKTRQLNTI